MAKSKKSEPEESKGNFWTTLPVTMKALAGLISAIVALITVLGLKGHFSKSEESKQTDRHQQSRNDEISATHDTHIVTPPDSGPATQKSVTPGPVAPGDPGSRVATSKYPADLKCPDPTTAGEYSFKILSAQLKEHGTDSITHAKTLILTLVVHETFNAKFGTGYFMADGFHLVIGDDTLSPATYPNENVDHGTSKNGAVTFIVPESAKQAVLRVGYYDGQRTEMTLDLTPVGK